MAEHLSVSKSILILSEGSLFVDDNKFERCSLRNEQQLNLLLLSIRTFHRQFLFLFSFLSKTQFINYCKFSDRNFVVKSVLRIIKTSLCPSTVKNRNDLRKISKKTCWTSLCPFQVYRTLPFSQALSGSLISLEHKKATWRSEPWDCKSCLGSLELVFAKNGDTETKTSTLCSIFENWIEFFKTFFFIWNWNWYKILNGIRWFPMGPITAFDLPSVTLLRNLLKIFW